MEEMVIPQVWLLYFKIYGNAKGVLDGIKSIFHIAAQQNCDLGNLSLTGEYSPNVLQAINENISESHCLLTPNV